MYPSAPIKSPLPLPRNTVNEATDFAGEQEANVSRILDPGFSDIILLGKLSLIVSSQNGNNEWLELNNEWLELNQYLSALDNSPPIN